MTTNHKAMREDFIHGLANECEELSLIEADIALDDARRYLWIKQFSGASDEALKEHLDGPHLKVGLRIASKLIGIVTPMDAEQVFLEVRSILWMSEFASVPNSIFARHLQALHERNRKETVIQ